MRPLVYQLFVRHFSNFRENGNEWGSVKENGCGKFNHITDAALHEIARMGFTHIWFTGVLRHATQTDYPDLPSQPQCIVKGKAGSPYSVIDYFDVCPDLAEDPSRRMEEYEDLLKRCTLLGLIPMMDFVPNHVSRAYCSEVCPEKNFGLHDNTSVFAARDNSFYYLSPNATGGGPPLRLPDGLFEPEKNIGKVTGNNAATWEPSRNDWYETVKLNYGWDYTIGEEGMHSLPGWLSRRCETPRTWQIMDDILAFWQDRGVGGFRCDMAQMVPAQFWKWAIARARVRNSSVVFLAEAYNDHMRTTSGDALTALLDSGFIGVYDAETFHAFHGLYDSGRWANDLDQYNKNDDRLFIGGVRYLENHDEQRICSPQSWGGYGEKVFQAAAVAAYASSRGPLLFYNGQEVGERAEGPGGYGGHDGRTSIFDYTCLPRLSRWSCHGKYDGSSLMDDERAMRRFYSRLMPLLHHPALASGLFYGLNWANQANFSFGRVDGETVSGHWVFAFIRHDWQSRSTVLVVCNLSPDCDFDGLTVHIPMHAQEWCGLGNQKQYIFSDMLASDSVPLLSSAEELCTSGLPVPLKAGKAVLFEWKEVL